MEKLLNSCFIYVLPQFIWNFSFSLKYLFVANIDSLLVLLLFVKNPSVSLINSSSFCIQRSKIRSRGRCFNHIKVYITRHCLSGIYLHVSVTTRVSTPLSIAVIVGIVPVTGKVEKNKN